jgi:polyisoprenoid-binding protein YceI
MKMASFRNISALAVTLLIAIPHPAPRANRTTYSIDNQKSKIEIQVARDGFLKAFGHDHLVSATQFAGEVKMDPAKIEDSSVSFIVETASLKVIDPGESEKERNEVQATMLGDQVLDAGHYPQIKFSSSSVKSKSNSNGVFELQVEGILNLLGAAKSMPVPVRVQIGDDGTLTADAEISLLQSDFGIAPYKAAGGTVRVKDRLKLTFHIVAHKAANQ